MDYLSIYVDFLVKSAKIQKPISLIADASNGATGKILEALLPKLDLKSFKILNSEGNPEFPAHGPNPLLPGVLDELSKTVLEEKADLGVAFDADGDRIFFVDDSGKILQSFTIGAVLFHHSEKPYVADELVYEAHRCMGIFKEDELFPAKVGALFIKEKMKEVGAKVAVEFSGHIFFKEFFGTDAGIFTMIQMISLLSSGEKKLSEIIEGLPQHVVKNIDLDISGKNWPKIEEKILDSYSKNTEVKIEKREGITIEYKDKWLNVRTSNTEPLLRIYAGARTSEECDKLIEDARSLV